MTKPSLFLLGYILMSQMFPTVLKCKRNLQVSLGNGAFLVVTCHYFQDKDVG